MLACRRGSASTPAQITATTLTTIPLESASWSISVDSLYSPAPVVEFPGDALIRVTIEQPGTNQSPRVSLWATAAPPVGAGTPYVMEAETRLDPPDARGNFLVGVNLRTGSQANFFQHWHLNQLQDGNGATLDPHYCGDWSEQVCQSAVLADGLFHTYRLSWDGADKLQYTVDGALVCDQVRAHEFILAPNDQAGFRLYAEHYPYGNGAYVLEVRRFAVWTG